ncbi:pitrilysin family protein [Candidatus Aciduliprofundum boonei]|uniref:Peptidase M16 domain protein n=1 Tax=Aciduliprofundum boonei (strain DSM 19572 / T469) TaxID=439481 RepID=B5I9E0_ACIB4|nr:insulinase family protein [Candidatus Aciduliprofundum boonei]ADD08591.1 peptidase M16 domain protein [Aciduliprofundum boonei T469]EDY36908.1 Peptidase M16 inactive domain family [Aciduliprofundum boonei T469]HII55640.1 insulinase family protein [Candidatus Aciduliprofundum boonei]
MKVKSVNGPKKLANVLLSVNVGWSHEPVGMRGISHFLEHSVFLGSGEHPEPDMDVGKYGVMLNGETQADRTNFFFSSLPEDAEDVLEILLSLVYHPSFPPEKVEEEKESKIIPAVVKESDFYPWELAYEWARNLIFEWDFRYSMGTEDEFRSIGIEELREWHRKHYHSGNSLLLASEGIDIPNITIPEGHSRPEVQRIVYGEREKIIEKDMKNAEIVCAFPLDKYDIRTYLLSILLGNYATSRLWREFHRDAYMVESKVEWHNGKGGFFLYVGANSRDFKSICERMENLLEGLHFTGEEVEIAKKIFAIEILERDNSVYRMESILNIDPELRFGSVEKILGAIGELELHDVDEYAYQVLNLEEMRRVVVK